MKKSFSILLLSLIASVAYAGPANEKSEKSKTEKETVDATKIQDQTKSKVQDSAEQTEKATIQETKTNDPDSSYYSVNKFNYLFYYVYKIKYLSEDDPDLIMGVKP